LSALIVDGGPRPPQRWKLDLTGPSGGATGAQIRLGTLEAAGKVALTLCAPCGSAMQGRRAIAAGLATATNPGGEVCGQLVYSTQGVVACTHALGTILTSSPTPARRSTVPARQDARGHEGSGLERLRGAVARHRRNHRPEDRRL